MSARLLGFGNNTVCKVNGCIRKQFDPLPFPPFPMWQGRVLEQCVNHHIQYGFHRVHAFRNTWNSLCTLNHPASRPLLLMAKSDWTKGSAREDIKIYWVARGHPHPSTWPSGEKHLLCTLRISTHHLLAFVFTHDNHWRCLNCCNASLHRLLGACKC